MCVGAGADIGVVAVIVAGLLLLELTSFFSIVSISIGFDAGSDAAAWTGVVVGIIAGVLLVTLPTFFSSAGFEFISFDAGADIATTMVLVKRLLSAAIVAGFA